MLVGVYLTAALVALAVITPALLLSRHQLGFPAVSVVAGIPVAAYGIYFYTVLAVGVAGAAAFVRGAGAVVSAIFAVAGLGAFEFLYAVAYALTTRQPGLLLPRWGLPVAGWPGFATWALAELLVASFVLVGWDRAAVDRTVLAVGAVFLVGLLVWGLFLGWRYPPFDNSPAVFVVNTITEVSGAVLAPLVFTSRVRSEPDFLHRAWGRIAPSSLPAAPP